MLCTPTPTPRPSMSHLSLLLLPVPSPAQVPGICMLRQRCLPLLPSGMRRGWGAGAQIALVISTAISMCLPLPNFSLALPPLLMEELESRQVGRRVSEWDGGLRWPGGLRVKCQSLGSGAELRDQGWCYTCCSGIGIQSETPTLHVT